MGNGSNSFKSEGNFASPACMAAEVDPGYFRFFAKIPWGIHLVNPEW